MKPTKKGVPSSINEEDIEGAGALDRPLDDGHLHDTGDHAAQRKAKKVPQRCNLIAFEIIYHYDGRNGQQVQQVDADGKAHHVEYENQPPVGARKMMTIGFAFLVNFMFPFQDGPEYDGGKQGGEGVHFTFNSAVPE